MIYCLEILNFKYVKFGYTSKNDLQQRIANLQTGNPFEIRAVFFIEGTLKQEKELHKSLTKAFGRMKIPIPPNEWYPGRNTAIKHTLEMITQSNGGINHALSVLDRYDPSMNQGGKEMQTRSYEPRIEWPQVMSAKFSAEFGNYNNGKAPKIKTKTSKKALRAEKRSLDKFAMK